MPGAVYQVPSSTPGYDKLIVSAGTGVKHRLNIYRNGSYQWAAYGKIAHGRWTPTGDSGYPIALRNAYEGKNWRIGYDPRTGLVHVWDGSTWFDAKP